MAVPRRRMRWVSLVALLAGLLWASPVLGAPLTARWGVSGAGPAPPPPSPFYDCPTWGGGGLICSWLWDEGLVIEPSLVGFLPMYGDYDAFFDAYGLHPPFESELTGADPGYLAISVRCLTGFEPCFDMFTPRSIDVSVYTDWGPAGVFFTSSRGGLITAPAGSVTMNFAGPEWTDISGMNIGIYLPDACADPESGLRCAQGELGLDVYRLTFDATSIPEPASLLLVGTALVAALRRRRCR